MFLKIADSLYNSKIDSLEKVVKALKLQMDSVNPQAIVQQSHDFYSNSFFMLLAVFALVGVGIPFWVNYIQKKQLKANEVEIILRAFSEIERATKELEVYIKNEVDSSLKTSKRFTESLDYFNSAYNEWKEGDTRSALFDYCMALISFSMLREQEWSNRVLSSFCNFLESIIHEEKNSIGSINWIIEETAKYKDLFEHEQYNRFVKLVSLLDDEEI